MNIKKPLLIAGAVSGISLAGLSATGMASAATASDSSTDNPMSSLVTKLAEKFSLDQSEVQAVFDEERAAQESERQQEIETKLSQAVTDGELTDAQKSAILAKRAELKSKMEQNRDSMKDKSDEERKSAMEAERTALQDWAEQNDIAEEYLRYVMGGGHRGPGGPGIRPEGRPAADQN